MSSDDRTGAFGLRDFLVPYVLLAISAQRAHGYLIEQYIRGLGLAQVEMSTLYRTLRQLEKQGLVTSTWEAGPGGPARRVYSLTNAGEAWLRTGAGALAAYRSAIDAFFGKYESAVPRARRPRRRSDEVERAPRTGAPTPGAVRKGSARPRVGRKRGTSK